MGRYSSRALSRTVPLQSQRNIASLQGLSNPVIKPSGQVHASHHRDLEGARVLDVAMTLGPSSMLFLV